MTEERKETAEGYEFIKEKILPKKKSFWATKKGMVLFVIAMAVLFGVASQVVFRVSGNLFENWWGSVNERHEVELPKPTTPQREEVSLTKAPEKTPTPEPTDYPVTPTEMPVPTPDVNAGTTGDTENPPEQTENPDNKGTAETDVKLGFIELYGEICRVAEEASATFVKVEAIEQGVDWFQEVYENRTRTAGIVLGNDGVDLLILVGTEQFSGATSIEVTVGEETFSGRIYSMDKDYGLAVIAVALNQIPTELMEQIQPGILAEKEDIKVGTPVIALGAPNGYENSMEYGMITSLGSKIPVTDGEVEYFTTNITEYPQGYGFVVNLEGKILGLITHTQKENSEDGIFSAVSLNSISGVIVKLLNNAERAYVGIKGQDVPVNLKKEYQLENGIYVREVENASPALSAGIKAGDIILSVGETVVENMQHFSELILECGTKDIIQVKILRNAGDGPKESVIEVSLIGKNRN